MVKNSKKSVPIDIIPSNELSQSFVRELHAMNPWWKGNSMGKVPVFRRSMYKLLYESVIRGRYNIVALRGPRQVGKTVLQEQMIQDLLKQNQIVSARQVLRVQFEDLSFLNIEDPILTIIRWFETNVVQDTFNNMAKKGLPIYIFLDEFQGIKNWSSQLKYIRDFSECKIFVTGSSALRIIAGKESMAGRVQWNEINTLGLAEICAFRQYGTLSPYCSETNLSEWLNKDFWLKLKNGQWQDGNNLSLIDTAYEKFCDFGGYPFCHTDREISWRDAEDYLFETVVAKTIELDLKAKFESVLGGSVSFMDSTLLTNAFRVFCKYTGHDISIDKLHDELKSSYSINLQHIQIRTILEFFELSMLIKVVKPFEHRLKNPKEHVKICLCDHAIRKAWLKEDVPLYGPNVNADLAGHVIEGVIGTFFKSVKQLGVSYFPAVGKGKEAEGEVDFILEIGVHHIPVEVKYKNKPDLGKGMRDFLDKNAYNAPFGLVITKEEIPLDYFSSDGSIIPLSVRKLLMLK